MTGIYNLASYVVKVGGYMAVAPPTSTVNCKTDAYRNFILQKKNTLI